MSQSLKNKKFAATQAAKKKRSKRKTDRKEHAEYGTSKLEEDFAEKFLDRLGIKYVYQFNAESIGRYYDFFIPSAMLLIEVDGDYYHAKGLVKEQMNPMQKHNRRVDKQKDHWALSNGFTLLRIWENDIRHHPEKVIQTLKDIVVLGEEKKKITEKKKNGLKKC